MKKVYFIILIITVFILMVIVFNKPTKQELQTSPSEENQVSRKETETSQLPIERARERVTKKPFGIKISPDNSPVSPERFSGYHTGVDYEIFENEEDSDVQIFAICDGKLLRKEKVSGYGGVLIQECELDNQPVTVLYGHIRLSSAQQSIGDFILKGNKLAVLGKGFSQDNDGERKHLHLGIYKNTSINLRGYVQIQSELNDWINFEEYIKEPL